MNKSLFQILLDRAASDSVVIRNSEKSRYIAKLSDIDSSLLSDAKLSSLSLGRRSRIVKVEGGGEIYFCLFGFPTPDFLPEGTQVTSITPALFTCGVLEAKIAATATGFEIKNAIEADFMGVPEYSGHDVVTIANLFPQMQFYKGDVNYEYQHDLQRIMGSFMVRTLDNLQIELELSTISELVDFFEGGSPHIPYANVARGMMSFTWEGIFLDAYRCIEQIYACTKVAALRDDWTSNKPLRQLAELLESHLAWRPKEEDALASILEKCDKTAIRDACILLHLPAEETVLVEGQETIRPRTDDKLAKSVASAIYSIRNNLVHYRPVHEIIKKTDEEWNGILRLMLQLVRQAYDLFGPVFFEEEIDIGAGDEVAVA